MDATTTPATKITTKAWTGLNISRNLRVQDGQIVADLYLGASCQAQEFVGDKDGVPQQPVGVHPGMGQPAVAIPQDKLQAVFNSQAPEGMTVLEFIEQELGKLAKAALP